MSNPSDTDIAWLAGLLEGEGCFHWEAHINRPGRRPSLRIALKMTDKDVVERAAALMGANVHPGEDPRSDKFSTVYQANVHGRIAERVMRLVRPHMGARRSAKIDEILSAPPGTFSHQPRPKEAA